MANDVTPDLCVIGGGTAGHAVALAAAALGARCTLIDPRPRLGAGQAADLFETMLFAQAAAHPAGAPFDLIALRHRLGRALAAQAASHSAERLGTVGVTVVRGEAVFVDSRTVAVAGRPIRARNFVLATGAAPADPAWAAALAPGERLRPADLLGRPDLAPAIAIVAATPSGFEWAQALHRLGCAVTLVMERGATEPFDTETLSPLLAVLRRQGVILLLDAPPSAARPGVPVMVLGRPVPAVATLQLARAGVACRDDAPVIDRSLRTTNPQVFALGDVLGRIRPGGAAIAPEVELVLRAALFRLPARPAPLLVTLRTQPAVAQVGVMAGAGQDSGRRVLRFPLADTPLGLAQGSAGGVKIVAGRRGRILGVGIVGPGAADAIGPWVAAVACRLPLGAMAGLPVPAASLAEGGRRAALAFVAVRLRSPWVKRLVAVLRRLPTRGQAWPWR